MPTADSAKLQYEAGQTPVAMAALSDSGDHTIFTAASSPWSQASGYTPVVRPNGLISGGEITAAASGSNDVVDVAAGTAYINGSLVSWSAATDESITRATSTDTHMVNSITITSAGAVAVVTGTDHASAFSETRAADGGPPLIATTSIEIGQVRTTSFTAAAIDSDEIHQTVGTHLERYDYPVYDVNYYTGKATFIAALPLIHTGAVAKGVYASYSTPVFAEIQSATDFVPPDNSYTVSSVQIYNRTIGSTQASLNAGSFTAYLNDGVTDGLVTSAGDIRWFKFHPDRYKSPYVMSQGKLGIARTYPANDQIRAQCTIGAESVATNVSA